MICLVIAGLAQADSYSGVARERLLINQAIGRQGFAFPAWEAQALAQKARDLIVRPGAELSAEQQHDLVTAYFAGIERIDDLTARIERIYADPQEASPAAASASLQAELDALRQKQTARRPAVERIIEGQVAAVALEEGLTTTLPGIGREVFWPPVRFQFTASPAVLIISPRERIEVERTVHLQPILAVAEMERIEGQITAQLDRSALIEGTGGLSSYPTMIIEFPSMDWVVSTVAHEWLHTYLLFRPLGLHYFESSETRTINETTVSIAGDELGQLLLARFYPDRLPDSSWPRPPAGLPRPKEQRPFEFGPFMRETRLQADQLLAAGRITEAESYMEARRQELVGHGYTIRKLNQAYFAFHGSYAVGASATDPIGGKLRLLRQQLGSLAVFLRIVAQITTEVELDAALAGL